MRSWRGLLFNVKGDQASIKKVALIELGAAVYFG
jgi:hypothetical protein